MISYWFYLIWRLIQDAGVWTVGWFGRTKSKTIGKILAALALPFAAIRILAGRLAGRLEIPYFDLVITTRCSLHCIHCSNLMQFYGRGPYKHSYHIPVDQIIADLEKLLGAVDFIQTMTVLGGEPFLHPGLAELLAYLNSKTKIRHLQVITNGTIVPAEEILGWCTGKKIRVLISDYKGKVYYERLISALRRRGVRHKVLHPGYWRSYGGLSPRNRLKEELSRVFTGCRVPNCRSFLNGEFHLCPRSSAGMDLGIVPRRNEDFVSVRNDIDIRLNLKRLLGKRYISACNYCDNSRIFPLIKVIPGEQARPRGSNPQCGRVAPDYIF
jgi:hypothetical protein